MIRRFLGAVQFLTVLPVAAKTVEPGRAALFFPLIGAGVGWLGAWLFLLFDMAVPTQLGSLLVVALWIASSGGLHEDGLADVADAFRSGRSSDRILEILKDPRVGAIGALAVTLSVLVRWQGLAAVSRNFVPAVVASQAVPRAAMVVMAWVSRPAGSGLGAAFCASVTTPVALLAAAQGVGFALWCGVRAAIPMLAGTTAIVILAHRYFHRRIGGVTGDCLGATSQLVECFLLVFLACANCYS